MKLLQSIFVRGHVEPRLVTVAGMYVGAAAFLWIIGDALLRILTALFNR